MMAQILFKIVDPMMHAEVGYRVNLESGVCVFEGLALPSHVGCSLGTKHVDTSISTFILHH